MTDEEKQKLEQEFQYALDNIVSKIKGETATAIVVSEQSMILLFNKLMLKIEKQSKEIEEYKKQLDLDYVDKHFVPIERYNQLEKEIEELKEDNKKKSIVIIEYQDLYEKLEDKIKEKIEEFKIIRNTILENEKECNRPMMTYDLKRNDYCEKE